MPPRKLYAWTNAQLDLVAGTLTRSWDLWLRDWGPEAAGPLRCRPATAGDAKAGWQPAAHGGERRAWLAAQTLQVVGAALFNSPHMTEAGAARRVAADAFADLRACIAAALKLVPVLSDAEAVDPATGPWCGSVAVELPLAGHSLCLMLNAPCVAGLLPPAVPADAPGRLGAADLVAPQAAMSGQIVALKVELSACELDVGTLQSLRIGDVLPLSHSLDEPARVLGPGDQHVCDAYLGKQGSRKAAELTRSRP